MKKQLRRNNEKKQLDQVDDNLFDMNISEISGTIERVAPGQEAHVPNPSEAPFDVPQKEEIPPQAPANPTERRTSLRATKEKLIHVVDSNKQTLENGKQMCKSPRQPLNTERSDGSAQPNGRVSPAAKVAKPTLASSPKNDLRDSGAWAKNRKLCKMINIDTKDCFICTKKKTFEGIITASLGRKYLTTRESYNTKVVSDIIYNENTHIVSVFKDYLIYDDISEFLKRFYATRETATRLPKIYDFYDKYSKVFPNYIVLREKKYMFKNISKKQRVIDEQQKRATEVEEKKAEIDLNDESGLGTNSKRVLFTPTIMKDLNKSDSIFEKTDKGDSDTQLKSYIKSQPKGDMDQSEDFKDMTLRELVDRFIQKDSRSFIDINAVLKDMSENPKPITNSKEIKITPTLKSIKKTDVKPAYTYKKAVAVEKVLEDEKATHLRGKSSNDAPMAAMVNPTIPKQSMKQIADAKALSIKIESATANKRSSSQQQPTRDPTDSNNAMNEKSTKADTTNKSSNKSRNPHTQPAVKQVHASPAKPQSARVIPASSQPSTSKRSSSQIAVNAASSAAVPYGSKPEVRSHSQGGDGKRGVASAASSTRATVKGKTTPTSKNPFMPIKSSKTVTKHETRTSTKKFAAESTSRGNANSSKGSVENARSSSARPTTRVTTAQSPHRATPTKGMPGTGMLDTQKIITGSGSSKGMPLSARNTTNATPKKMQVQVHSPPVARPASGSCLAKGGRLDAKGSTEKINAVNILKVDIDTFGKKKLPENKKTVPQAQPSTQTQGESGKKFRSDYLNALSAKRADVADEHKFSIPKQGSAAEPPLVTAPSPSLNYSKSVETFEKGREDKSTPKLKAELKRVESKPTLSTFSGKMESKKLAEGSSSSKTSSAYYQQFIKVGNSGSK